MIEIFLQGFAIIWLILGGGMLLFMYMNKSTRKNVYFFLSTFLVLVAVSYSIYRENIISFRPFIGYPTEQVRYIGHRLDIKDKDVTINLWATKTSDKRDALFVFPYDEQIEKTLNEAKKQQKGGRSTLLKIVKTPQDGGPSVDSGAKMIGEIETVNKLPDKFTDEEN